MRAVVTRPGATGSLVIAETAEPSPDSDEALVRVKAFSLNRGEVRRAATRAAGTMIGWDVVGAVEGPARKRQRAPERRAGGRVFATRAWLGGADRTADDRHCRDP